MAVLEPNKSEAVAESLTRLRGALERKLQRRFPALDAQEVYQRAAVRALERCESVRDLARVDAWVRRIVVTCALDIFRERMREPATSDAEDLEAPAPEDPACRCTLSLLPSLHASYADILRRIDVEGVSLPETAADLHIEVGNAAVRLHRARRALRDRLRDHCGVETMTQCLSCSCDEHSCGGTL